MPRPNKGRTIGAEDRLAFRMGTERKARGWTLAQMADAMTAVGCPMHASTIFKIEKRERKIYVDEIVAVSTIWQIPVGKLLSS